MANDNVTVDIENPLNNGTWWAWVVYDGNIEVASGLELSRELADEMGTFRANCYRELKK